MRFNSGLVLACAICATAAGISTAKYVHAEGSAFPIATAPASISGQETKTTPEASSQSNSQPRTAVVLRFAVQSQPLTDEAALSAQACPKTPNNAPPSEVGSAGTSQKPITVNPAILDKITNEMQSKLSKKMTVLVNPDPHSIPEGALVISGCITRANAGNSVERLVGMGLGASHLNVHIVALSRAKDGWNPVDTFDLQVKGGSLLPPLGPVGLAVHAARDTQQTLSADSKKLADRVLKKLAKDRKAQQQAQRNS
jgi:Domain of unknown function (DUF4410)